MLLQWNCTRTGAFPGAFCVPNSVALASPTASAGCNFGQTAGPSLIKFGTREGGREGREGREGRGWEGRGGEGRGGGGQCRAGQGRAGQGRAGQGRAGEGRGGEGRGGRGGEGRGGEVSTLSTNQNLCDRGA